MTAPLAIDVVSDVVCPWCFIGKSRLEQALELRPDIPVEIRWHPYFLNDWIPREGISREDYLTRKFGSPERYKSIAWRVAAAGKAAAVVGRYTYLTRELLASDRDVDRVTQEAEQAKQAGIDGVPCFIFGGVLAVSGAQDPAYLAEAMARAADDVDKRRSAATAAE